MFEFHFLVLTQAFFLIPCSSSELTAKRDPQEQRRLFIPIIRLSVYISIIRPHDWSVMSNHNHCYI